MRPKPDASVRAGSLGDSLPGGPQAKEAVDLLAESSGMRVERIVSTGQVTPEDQWYDQAWDEYVLLVAGAARLRIEGEEEDRAMQAGDWIMLPAHCRHRVTWTQKDPPTVWLAIHYDTAKSQA